MDKWFNESMSGVLGFEFTDDLLEFMLSVDSETELKIYMDGLLDFDDPQHKEFFQDFTNLKRSGKLPKKAEVEEEDMVAMSSQSLSRVDLPEMPLWVHSPIKGQTKKKISKQKHRSQHNFVIVEAELGEPIAKPKKNKKKTKFVNLYSNEGQNAQVIMLKGRHLCECDASVHGLINNCTNCGRIVCKQEGAGPCMFCGDLVYPEEPEEEQELTSNMYDDTLLTGQVQTDGLAAALKERNRLLDYDRNSDKRTRVIDDDCDYFNTSDIWVEKKKKENLRKYQESLRERRRTSRFNNTVTFDFGGRQIVMENVIHQADLDLIDEIMGDGSKRIERPCPNDVADFDDSPKHRATTIQADHTVEEDDEYQDDYQENYPDGYATRARVEMLRILAEVEGETTDQSLCICIPQPGASLLVRGIKMHEGIAWYVKHRGWLWIVATAEEIENETTSILEVQYREICTEKNIRFPIYFHSGCLLGCVYVEDCLPQEVYQELHPEDETDSPYVLICSNPFITTMRFPIKEQPGLCALDTTMHDAAARNILVPGIDN